MNTATSTPPGLLFLATEIFAAGGIQRFNQTVLAAYARCHIECRVLSLNDTPSSIAAGISHPNVTVSGFCGNRRRFALAVLHSLWSHRHDWLLVGHINFLLLAVICRLLMPFKRPAPILLFAHGIEVWSGIGRRRRYALLRTTKILCVSRYTRQRMIDQVPSLQPARLSVFPNALAETWRSVGRSAAIRKLPDRFILSVTRIQRGDRYKGIVTVIEALSMLTDDGIHYCVVGRGDDMPFLRQVAARCGVGHRVHFMSDARDAELIALYEQCDAFVLPSGKEGFGIVFLEAMYFGAPVIAAAMKGALDVVRDGETGLLVRFGDCVAVKDAIERLGANPELRELLRASGRATVADGGPFTFSRFAERCSEVLGLGAVHAS